jgi:hypothetical protein
MTDDLARQRRVIPKGNPITALLAGACLGVDVPTAQLAERRLHWSSVGITSVSILPCGLEPQADGVDAVAEARGVRTIGENVAEV